MKGIFLFLSLFFAPLGFLHSAVADDASDIARAATRRGSTNTVTNTRKKTENPTQKNSHSANTVSRSTNTTPQTNNSLRERNVGNRSGNVVSTADRGAASDAKKQNVTARTAATVAPRATTARVTTPTKPTIRQSTQTPARNASRVPNRGAISRNAVETATAAREKIMSAKYADCRTVYYDCMDEFCANKDSLLKRCACSARTNEFTGVQKQLDQAEEKLLDFGERLLSVNLDAEDATAMFNATAGELAFQQADTTTSKKILDEIAKKLNTKIDSSTFEQNLSPISLSLNEDAAWDSVDSMRGASTTVKSGTELYAAALPVCREMALEICTPDELDIIESGYQMAIEQDCNTVAKSYVNQTDAAREKIRESSALLDMARLDIYQKRNSDDILTCKTKMLDMLTNTSVCGENLGKCLDTTGQYIDPSTGEAFLTMDLANLAHLITRPSGNQTWTNAPGNAKFVSYLYSKKQYLEPAMENCQDVSDYVWDNFIEDALAQIKLAQDAKLEEVRQSCTTLTTQCLSETAKSLADFDARALSTFGVAADKTVNAMCADVKNACTALLQETGGGSQDWVGGMTEIATDTTYETLLQTCREVGRACIIQACKSISGNFGLCENIDTSINRKSIINRTSCWNEVLSCVKSAGEESINNIITQLNDRKIISIEGQTKNPAIPNENNENGEPTTITVDIPANAFYESLYGQSIHYIEQPGSLSGCESKANYLNCIYDICYSECGKNNTASFECRSCRIAEQIWGNCEVSPATVLAANTTMNQDEKDKIKYHNRIKKPIGTDATTLLYWFAVNTGTDMRDDACRDTTCGPGFVPRQTEKDGYIVTTCVSSDNIDSLDNVCPTKVYYTPVEANVSFNLCCATSSKDNFLNCCMAKANEKDKICGTDAGATVVLTTDNLSNNYYFTGANTLICKGTVSTITPADTQDGFPNGNKITCSGKWIMVSQDTGHYYNANPNDTTEQPVEKTTVQYNDGTDATECKYIKENNEWTDKNGTNCPATPDNWTVQY